MNIAVTTLFHITLNVPACIIIYFSDASWRANCGDWIKTVTLCFEEDTMDVIEHEIKKLLKY